MSTDEKPQEELSVTRQKGTDGYHGAVAPSTVALTNNFFQSTRQPLHALGPVVFLLKLFGKKKMKDCHELTQRHYADPEILSEILRRRVTSEEAQNTNESTTNRGNEQKKPENDTAEVSLACPQPTPEDSGFLAREISGVIDSTKKIWHAVCSFNHLPHWLQDNEYLCNGHRPPYNDFKACIYSIFSIHTETGNIWTHILGCIFFFGIYCNLMAAPDMEVIDKTVIGIFLLGAMTCFFMSFLFHAVCCHSEPVAKLFNKLDYCGICILGTTSLVPWLYYSFYCRFALQLGYLILVTAFGFVVVMISFNDMISGTDQRPLRTIVFVTYGLCSALPAAHYAITEGFNRFVWWSVLMGLFYLTGATVYVCRVPERFCPGKFDIWFHSHQIFHVFVVVAASIHYHGVTEMWSHRKAFGSCVG